jgi:hypothetical protein
MKGLGAFVCGALVGAALTAYLTSDAGEELREKIREILIKRGVVPSGDMDDFIDAFAAEIEDD